MQKVAVGVVVTELAIQVRHDVADQGTDDDLVHYDSDDDP